MAVIIFGLDHICGGGEHVSITANKDGGGSKTFHYTSNDMLDPLTDEQFHEAALVVLRLRMQGKTKLQARNDLQAGFTVTI
jgi:hypothetical protein